MTEQTEPKRIVLMALDGALVSLFEEQSAGQNFEKLKRLVSKLQAARSLLVLFTVCDRAEVEPIRAQLGITAPFIVESGSAIFASPDAHPFDAELGEKEDGYFVVMLGCPYVQARAGLRVIANEISHPLKGFGDFTVPQLERAAKLSEGAAHRAKAREFSEPFMTPKAVESEVLYRAASEMGFDVILRSESESRFSELVGAGAGLDKAFKTLVEAYQSGTDDLLEIVVVSGRSEDFAALAKASDGMAGLKTTEVLLAENTVDGLVSAIAPLAKSDS